MLDDARCECGCRIFFNKQTIITTACGTVRDIPSAMVLECVRCLRLYSVSMDPGKKTLEHFGIGKDSEAKLFKTAIKDWENKHTPDRNPTMVVLSPADEVDYERLGVAR
jgi:hypothetical protein